MNDLVVLRKAADSAKNLFDGLGAMNVWNKTVEERVEIDLVYERAWRAWRTAEEKYQTALASIALRDAETVDPAALAKVPENQ